MRTIEAVALKRHEFGQGYKCIAKARVDFDYQRALRIIISSSTVKIISIKIISLIKADFWDFKMNIQSGSLN